MTKARHSWPRPSVLPAAAARACKLMNQNAEPGIVSTWNVRHSPLRQHERPQPLELRMRPASGVSASGDWRRESTAGPNHGGRTQPCKQGPSLPELNRGSRKNTAPTVS